ncbi:hypothetical protein BOTBODRAFT_53941 [Botryobasidium botryosum FD-172 SS1]|uniref:Uncharacterized protein n=1 Tax=Botryobasidium botryosum (strain FD-172 SS1) TaxID=930990 RepID=A0A067ML24_BOTB1|nr:hypothetical protein BOTBODRAFT_53941 [Botryobasidium botryosum FD-172 SS1]
MDVQQLRIFVPRDNCHWYDLILTRSPTWSVCRICPRNPGGYTCRVRHLEVILVKTASDSRHSTSSISLAQSLVVLDTPGQSRGAVSRRY